MKAASNHVQNNHFLPYQCTGYKYFWYGQEPAKLTGYFSGISFSDAIFHAHALCKDSYGRIDEDTGCLLKIMVYGIL